jgi:hypothetical protein
MSILKRAELIQMICKQSHITRKVLKLPEFTKEELLKLHAFLVLTNDVVGARGDFLQMDSSNKANTSLP